MSSLVVNTNVASMNAQRSLMASSKELQSAMERLSTGKKINSAADDAAGFAIAESMTAQVRGLSMAAKNANDALGLLKVVENATNDVTDMLQRIRELAVQAQSGTNSSKDVANLQKEANALMDEIIRVSDDTTYNNKAYLGDDKGTINVQVGYNDGDTIAVTTYDIGADKLGYKLVTDDLIAGNAGNADSLKTLVQISGDT
jgi:flagellin